MRDIERGVEESHVRVSERSDRDLSLDVLGSSVGVLIKPARQQKGIISIWDPTDRREKLSHLLNLCQQPLGRLLSGVGSVVSSPERGELLEVGSRTIGGEELDDGLDVG